MAGRRHDAVHQLLGLREIGVRSQRGAVGPLADEPACCILQTARAHPRRALPEGAARGARRERVLHVIPFHPSQRGECHPFEHAGVAGRIELGAVVGGSHLVGRAVRQQYLGEQRHCLGIQGIGILAAHHLIRDGVVGVVAERPGRRYTGSERGELDAVHHLEAQNIPKPDLLGPEAVADRPQAWIGVVDLDLIGEVELIGEPVVNRVRKTGGEEMMHRPVGELDLARRRLVAQVGAVARELHSGHRGIPLVQRGVEGMERAVRAQVGRARGVDVDRGRRVQSAEGDCPAETGIGSPVGDRLGVGLAGGHVVAHLVIPDVVVVDQAELIFQMAVDLVGLSDRDVDHQVAVERIDAVDVAAAETAVEAAGRVRMLLRGGRRGCRGEKTGEQAGDQEKAERAAAHRATACAAVGAPAYDVCGVGSE